MWLLLFPLLLVTIVLSMILGTAAIFVTVARDMPVLLIALGAWIIWRANRPRPHRRAYRYGHREWRYEAGQRRPEAGPIIEHDTVKPPAVEPAAATPIQRPRRELPIDVQVMVEQITRKADVLQGYADRFPPMSQDLHIVRQTAADYLPRTVNAYLALPSDDDPFDITTNEQALQELRNQLRLLDVKLDEIAQDLQRQDMDRLLANRRFLEERFRPRELSEPAGSGKS
jgi:hypothetical protein